MPARLKIDGVSDVIQFLAAVGDTGGPAILRPILEDGARVMAQAIKAEAPVETGALRSAVTTSLASNPSKAIAYTTWDIDKALKARNQARTGRGRSPVGNKARYPFIVLAGSGPHRIVAKGKPLLLAGGHFAREVQHPGIPSNPFVDRAFRRERSRVESLLSSRIAIEFEKLKARYGA